MFCWFIITCCLYLYLHDEYLQHRSTRSSVVTLSRLPSSVFSLCLTSSLESTPCFSPTASCRSLHLGLWSSYACQFSFFHKCTTLIIHNSFTLPLPAQNLPFSQILPTIVLTLSPGLTQRTLAAHRFFSISGFVLVPWGRLSWFLPAFDRTLISHSYLLTYNFSPLLVFFMSRIFSRRLRSWDRQTDRHTDGSHHRLMFPER